MASRSFILSCFPPLIAALTATGALNDSVQKSAEQTCLKTGSDYRPVYDSGGLPTKCEAPARPMCFFGEYKDPKTGKMGCCGKDKGEFSIDPAHPNEGACCITPQTYSFDATNNKGSCCDPGQGYSVDSSSGVGGCCAAPLSYKCQCAGSPAPTDSGTGGGSPTPPADPPKECPDAHGWTFTQDGIDYMIDCEKGWNQNLGQGSWTKAVDIWECLKNCGAAGSECQGVNYWSETQDCGFALNWEFPATGMGGSGLMAAIPLQPKP